MRRRSLPLWFCAAQFDKDVVFSDVTFTGAATCAGAYARLDVDDLRIWPSGWLLATPPTPDAVRLHDMPGRWGPPVRPVRALTSRTRSGVAANDAVDAMWLHKRPPLGMSGCTPCFPAARATDTSWAALARVLDLPAGKRSQEVPATAFLDTRQSRAFADWCGATP